MIGVAILLLLAGCTSAASTAVVSDGVPTNTVAVSPRYSQDFASRALAWLRSQPPYHRKGHHNGILLAGDLPIQGDWYGLILEPSGYVASVTADNRDDSDLISLQVAVGDEVEFDYHWDDILSVTGGSQDIDVLKRSAVDP